jgi:hypothetical protein
VGRGRSVASRGFARRMDASFREARRVAHAKEGRACGWKKITHAHPRALGPG